MIQIKFDKKRLTKKYTYVEWSNYRIAAAKRSLNKEREKAGLFGEELMRFKSVDERKNQIEENMMDRIQNWRDQEAKTIRRCRNKFKKLSTDTQKDLINYWNNSSMAKEPFRFAGLINRYETDPLFFKRQKGEASQFVRYVIDKNRKLKVIEITEEEYYSQVYNIDKNK